MSELKVSMQELGLENVTTFINSGNVIFTGTNVTRLVEPIESKLAADFGFDIPVVIRTEKKFRELVSALPDDWTHGGEFSTQVMFLRSSYEREAVLNELSMRPGIDEAFYATGAVVWRTKRADASRSGLQKIPGTEFYRQMTMRNTNTVRKILALLDQ